ncbi:MAG: cytidylate kinase-like family protein [Spirochaetes bacterium]|nr:cytidylate kinase-like family protein [Spirochaetota bacterium]
MSVVTISRLEKSGGKVIGKQIADRLGYELITRETIAKIFKDYGIINFKQTYETPNGIWDYYDTFHAASIGLLKRLHLAFAHYGNVVIVGRGSFATLKDFSNVLNVRLWAPFDVRVKRYMDTMNVNDPVEAEKLVKEADRTRNAFVKSWFNARTDSNDFDLVINTDVVPMEESVSLIVDTVHSMEMRKQDKSKSIDSIDVDPVLERAVNELLSAAAVK